MGFVQKAKKLLGFLVAHLLHHKKTTLLVTVAVTVTVLVGSLTSIWLINLGNLRFPTVGIIRTSGLKAYWDAAFTNETTEISWGLLYPGSTPNVTVYLRSVSNIPISLAIISANWTFANAQDEIVYGPANHTEYMTLTWDYNGTALSPGQAIPVVFTLRIDATVGFVEYVIDKDVQSFSFEVNIRALEEGA